MLQGYLKMLGHRAVRWGTGAAVTVVFFLVAAAAGLPQWALFVALVVGALVGSVLAELLMRRLFGEEPPPAPAPRGRGSGRRGS